MEVLGSRPILRSCSCCGRRFRVSRLPVHEASTDQRLERFVAFCCLVAQLTGGSSWLEEICFRNAHKKSWLSASEQNRAVAVTCSKCTLLRSHVSALRRDTRAKRSCNMLLTVLTAAPPRRSVFESSRQRCEAVGPRITGPLLKRVLVTFSLHSSSMQ